MAGTLNTKTSSGSCKEFLAAVKEKEGNTLPSSFGNTYLLKEVF